MANACKVLHRQRIDGSPTTNNDVDHNKNNHNLCVNLCRSAWKWCKRNEMNTNDVCRLQAIPPKKHNSIYFLRHSTRELCTRDGTRSAGPSLIYEKRFSTINFTPSAITLVFFALKNCCRTWLKCDLNTSFFSPKPWVVDSVVDTGRLGIEPSIRILYTLRWLYDGYSNVSSRVRKLHFLFSNKSSNLSRQKMDASSHFHGTHMQAMTDVLNIDAQSQ